MTVTFDSNILVYAVDSRAGAKHVAAMDVLERASRSEGVLLLQSMAEFFRTTTRKLGLSIADARRALTDWRAVFPVYAADESSFDRAVTLVENHGLSFWDAMMVAAAHDAGCETLLSEDMQDGREIAKVRIVNPFDPANAAFTRRILGAG